MSAACGTLSTTFNNFLDVACFGSGDLWPVVTSKIMVSTSSDGLKVWIALPAIN